MGFLGKALRGGGRSRGGVEGVDLRPDGLDVVAELDHVDGHHYHRLCVAVNGLGHRVRKHVGGREFGGAIGGAHLADLSAVGETRED